MGGKLDQVKGRIKEAAGVLTGDDRLTRKGKLDQVVGKVKEKAEGAVDKIKDALTGKAGRDRRGFGKRVRRGRVGGSHQRAAGEQVMISRPVPTVYSWAVALLAAGVVASCGPSPSSQQPVRSSNPSVTYNYRTDEELLQANQNATRYCAPYQTAPRTANITNNSDGSKAATFECVPTTLPVAPPANPNLTYTYRTDQELVQASQTAGAYCVKYGSQPMTSTIVTNSDGSKTVTFQCGLR